MRKFLRRTEAAAYIVDKYGIPCSPKTLATWVTRGGGPLYRKAGRFPLYDPADLDTWAAARLGAPRHSSSVAA